jgi:GNAT superfamily N-acetyltransferase
MSVEVRPSRSGDGAGFARIWLDNARYYTKLFPGDFRLPDEDGLVEWFETALERPRDEAEIELVAAVDGTVAAFVYARLLEPDEDANRQMLANRPHRRVHVEALGTADAFQRRGLASQLVEAVEEWARERGAREISADTYLDSPVSIPFWEQRMGYRRRSVRLTKRLDTSAEEGV